MNSDVVINYHLFYCVLIVIEALLFLVVVLAEAPAWAIMLNGACVLTVGFIYWKRHKMMVGYYRETE